MNLTATLASQLPRSTLREIHRLRFKVFHDRLKWDVRVSLNEEKDHYDALDPTFVVSYSLEGKVSGCCRMLPTTGPYMLKDTFPSLLAGQDAPSSTSIWEISRFAIEKSPKSIAQFSDTPIALISEIVYFALSNHIKHYVFVTTVGFERLLNKMGVHCHRFSPPQMIGVERTVALWMHIDDLTIEAIAKTSNKLPTPAGIAA